MPKKKKEQVDWEEIRRLRTSSFYGTTPNAEQLRKCEQAWKEDPVRYGAIGDEVRENYRRAMRGIF